jgi:hypothetical protein
MCKPKNSGSATPTSNSQTFTALPEEGPDDAVPSLPRLRRRAATPVLTLRGSRPVITEDPGPQEEPGSASATLGAGTWEVDELIGKFVVVFAARPTALSDPAEGTVPPLESRKEYPK